MILGHFYVGITKKETNIENKLKSFIQEVEHNTNNYNNFNLDEFIKDNILKDIYWTATMKWQKISIHDIENNTWPDQLTKKETNNIKNAFEYVINYLIRWERFAIGLTADLLKDLHKIISEWLDDLVVNWLKYKSWRFRKWCILMLFNISWKDVYIPPYDWKKYLRMFLKEFNIRIILEQRFKVKISDIAIFHLVLYAIQPFWRWNESIIKIYESLFIQYHYDKNHYLVWMWYWFRKDRKRYFNKIQKVLSWEEDVSSWLKYYLDSFGAMIEYSKNLYNIKRKFKLEYIVSKNRLKYYNTMSESKILQLKDSDSIIITELITWINTTWINNITIDTITNILWEYKTLPSNTKWIIYSKIKKYLKDKILIPNFEYKDYYDSKIICNENYKLNEKVFIIFNDLPIL